MTAAAPDTYFLTKTADATLSVSNDLLGSDGTVEGNGSIYALAKINDAVGFFQVMAGTFVPKGKAYLVSSSDVKGFLFDDDATGIDKAKLSTFNSQLSTPTGPWYNVAGQQISRPVKGVNISKGKKVLK